MIDRQTIVSFAWPLALAAVATLGTLATACMMPFVAVATLAAVTLDRPRAITAIGGVWAVNQLLGFGLLGYPMTAYAMIWGLALGVGAGVALATARGILGQQAAPSMVKVMVAFAAAFAAFEVSLFAFALVAGGTGTFTAAIVARILLNDAAWLGGLAVLHVVLTRAAPRVFGLPAAVRFA